MNVNVEKSKLHFNENVASSDLDLILFTSRIIDLLVPRKQLVKVSGSRTKKLECEWNLQDAAPL